MDSPLDFLIDLNSAQHQAVTAGPGQILVLAGPGSGKTRVLTMRVAYLVNALGVHGSDILAVTFTNKAARQMVERVERLVPDSADRIQGLWMGTFHSICARILRRENRYLPLDSNFVIMDDDDQMSIVRRALKELNLDDKQYRPSGIHDAISNAKNAQVDPDDYPTRSYRDEVTARVYKRYNELLLASNGVDFDDLLLFATRLLANEPSVRERYARRFEHVLVDEFQDTNQVQYELLKHLSCVHNNLFAVGDEDQSIYRWRGADYRNVLRFEEDFPECQKILLEQNYRSTQTVLDSARAIIDRNPNRTPKALFTQRGQGEPVVLYEAVDDHAEAAYVVDTIRILMAGGKQKGGDFAVMYRTNAQSRLMEEAFLRSGLPYRLVGAQRFYGRREVKDLICYLRLVQNPADEVSLKRVINVPGRGIGDKTLVGLDVAAMQMNISASLVLLDVAEKGEFSAAWKVLGSRVPLLADFGLMLAEWLDKKTKIALPELFDTIVKDTGYFEHINDGTDEGRDRWDNVEELRRLAYEYAGKGLEAFLENLALVSDQDTLPEQSDAPTLLTLHAAKGLEFSQVFITGLDEGLLPHSRSRDDPEQMMEERRLLYVGMTRARNRLYLVRAERRSQYGSEELSEPCRFLQDLPSGLVKVEGVRTHSRTYKRENNWESAQYPRRDAAPTWDEAKRWNQPPPAPPAQTEAHFRPAMRVRHPTWGEGMVIDAKILDGEERVDVLFESVGFKRLLAAMANLEIIKK